MTKSFNYQITRFIMSTLDIHCLPINQGIEIAFTGYSNTGKSSALNTLTNQKKLARTSKTPGGTKLINLFEVAPGIRIVDLPGYGYTKISKKLKYRVPYIINKYLQKRNDLKGLVILMDIRYPMKDIDQQIIRWAVNVNISVLILLSKSDKLNYEARKKQLNQIRKAVSIFMGNVNVETFSSLKKHGVNKLRQKLDEWFSDISYKRINIHTQNVHLNLYK